MSLSLRAASSRATTRPISDSVQPRGSARPWSFVLAVAPGRSAVAQRELLQLQHEELLHPGMQACFDFVDQHQGAVELRDFAREAQDSPFAGGHVQLGVLRAAFLRSEEKVLGSAGQVDDLGVPEGKHLLGELDLGRRQRCLPRGGAEARHAQHAADLGWIAEVAERPEINGPLRRGSVLTAQKAAIPALGAAPSRRLPAVRRGIVELDDHLGLPVLAPAHLGPVEPPQSGGLVHLVVACVMACGRGCRRVSVVVRCLRASDDSDPGGCGFAGGNRRAGRRAGQDALRVRAGSSGAGGRRSSAAVARGTPAGRPRSVRRRG